MKMFHGVILFRVRSALDDLTVWILILGVFKVRLY